MGFCTFLFEKKMKTLDETRTLTTLNDQTHRDVDCSRASSSSSSSSSASIGSKNLLELYKDEMLNKKEKLNNLSVKENRVSSNEMLLDSNTTAISATMTTPTNITNLTNNLATDNNNHEINNNSDNNNNNNNLTGQVSAPLLATNTIALGREKRIRKQKAFDSDYVTYNIASSCFTSTSNNNQWSQSRKTKKSSSLKKVQNNNNHNSNVVHLVSEEKLLKTDKYMKKRIKMEEKSHDEYQPRSSSDAINFKSSDNRFAICKDDKHVVTAALTGINCRPSTTAAAAKATPRNDTFHRMNCENNHNANSSVEQHQQHDLKCYPEPKPCVGPNYEYLILKSKENKLTGCKRSNNRPASLASNSYNYSPESGLVDANCLMAHNNNNNNGSNLVMLNNYNHNQFENEDEFSDGEDEDDDDDDDDVAIDDSSDQNYSDIEGINRKKQKKSANKRIMNKVCLSNVPDAQIQMMNAKSYANQTSSFRATNGKKPSSKNFLSDELSATLCKGNPTISFGSNSTAETYLIDRYKYAVRHIRQGLSVEEACNKYRISKGALLKCLSGGTAPRGKKTRLTESEENEIVEWLINNKDLKYNEAIHLVFEQVEKIFHEAKRPNPFNNGKPSMDWWYDFLSRHPQIMASKPEWLRRGKVNDQYIRDVQSGKLRCTKFRRALLSAIQYIRSLSDAAQVAASLATEYSSSSNNSAIMAQFASNNNPMNQKSIKSKAYHNSNNSEFVSSSSLSSSSSSSVSSSNYQFSNSESKSYNNVKRKPKSSNNNEFNSQSVGRRMKIVQNQESMLTSSNLAQICSNQHNYLNQISNNNNDNEKLNSSTGVRLQAGHKDVVSHTRINLPAQSSTQQQQTRKREKNLPELCDIDSFNKYHHSSDLSHLDLDAAADNFLQNNAIKLEKVDYDDEDDDDNNVDLDRLVATLVSEEENRDSFLFKEELAAAVNSVGGKFSPEYDLNENYLKYSNASSPHTNLIVSDEIDENQHMHDLHKHHHSHHHHHSTDNDDEIDNSLNNISKILNETNLICLSSALAGAGAGSTSILDPNTNSDHMCSFDANGICSDQVNFARYDAKIKCSPPKSMKSYPETSSSTNNHHLFVQDDDQDFSDNLDVGYPHDSLMNPNVFSSFNDTLSHALAGEEVNFSHKEINPEDDHEEDDDDDDDEDEDEDDEYDGQTHITTLHEFS